MAFLIPRRTVIFALSLAVRIGLVLATGTYRQPVNPVETVLIARSLAAGRGFSNPYGCDTGPTAHLAPVYPYLLSLVYRIFPAGSSRELVIYVLSAIVVSLTFALLPWLAEQLRLDPRIGLLAGLAGAAVPLFFWVEIESEWEAPLSALLLVAGLGYFARLFHRISLRAALFTGLIWGVAILTAPTILPVFVALFAALAWHHRRHVAELFQPAAALLLPIALLTVPWIIRDYLVLHEVVPVRGNAGMQLHMSFNDQARATFDEGVASGAFLDHPHTTQRACEEFARRGEVAMNDVYEHEAWGWIREHKARTVQLIFQRFIAFWRMTVPSQSRTVASELLTLLGLAGLWLCLKRSRFAGELLAIVLIVFPLAYYVNFFEPRYRYPLHPLVLLLASFFLIETAPKFRRRVF